MQTNLETAFSQLAAALPNRTRATDPPLQKGDFLMGGNAGIPQALTASSIPIGAKSAAGSGFLAKYRTAVVTSVPATMEAM